MEISRFPCKRLLRMPGSTTTRGRHVSRDSDTGRVAFCGTENIGTPNLSYAAQYLACALPCERFTPAPRTTRASLGASTVRYTFTVTDFHRLPFAGLPGAPVHSINPGLMHRSKKGGNGVVSRTERFRRVIRCGAQQDIARWITSKRRRRWLHRLRAECPGGVPLWAANFRYGELPCILPVTDSLILRARQ
jgi:hypothetical protein